MPRRLRAALVAHAVLLVLALPADAGAGADAGALESLARQFRARIDLRRDDLFRRLSARRDGPQGLLNADPRLRLMFVDGRGVPRFYLTHNLNAARTVGTDHVWPGGATSYNLTGASTLLGELGIWDANRVRTTHQEFDGRVTQMDVPTETSSHATHVAGTLVAEGQDPGAKGMSFQAQLAAYEWTDDTAEMALAGAAGMLVSNHSYGFATGWLFNFDGSGRWFWFGDTTVSATEDYGFGYYDSTAADWDQIAFDAPEYTIVTSAGNDRNDAGPAQPDSHFVWDPGIEDWVYSMTVRDPDGAPLGYDTVSWFSTAKNLITVGAVDDIASGYTQPADVVMTSYSGWGPTDDGRIKPDMTANGTNLYSSTAASNASYGNSSGTSMASPNLAGSLNLLVQHYEATHSGTTPRSATMKAVLVHTASEAGPAPGPDYRFGWGLLNTRAAADAIAADAATPSLIQERTLSDGGFDVFTLVHAGGDLRLTIAWTDPPGTPPAPAVNPPDPMLVNDLDLSAILISPVVEHLPWVLDPSDPASPATTGINSRDNVEQVFVAGALAGSYSVGVRHKGTLAGGAQAYSIVSSAALTDGGVVDVPPAEPTLRFLGASPNPFRAGTTIHFELPASAHVGLAVYDLHGRRVRLLEQGLRGPGVHAVAWDGRDDRGLGLPAGVYFVRFDAGGVRRVGRIVRLE